MFIICKMNAHFITCKLIRFVLLGEGGGAVDDAGDAATPSLGQYRQVDLSTPLNLLKLLKLLNTLDPSTPLDLLTILNSSTITKPLNKHE